MLSTDPEHIIATSSVWPYKNRCIANKDWWSDLVCSLGDGLLVHPIYGSRLMLGGVVTTSELPRSGPTVGQAPVCPAGCRVCIDACPVHPISEDPSEVRIMKCLSYTARTPLMSRLHFGFLAAINKRAAGRYLSRTAFDELTMHVCSRCVSECPLGPAS